MGNTIKRHEEISEATIYHWNCPKCEFVNSTYDDPDYTEYLVCDGCTEQFKIED
ncbi:hypothetical protein T190611E02C_40315 [Tenacibaculum sp. 190524A05c]|uniref:hypothetical protein n=1 Tax=Tenacibaculum platacis TaxID=3137852 RepID=UPI0031FADC37